MRESDSRDAEWFRRVYAAHYPDVVRYGLRRLGGLGAAEELAQEVFVVAWRRRHDAPHPMLPWLYGVGRRLLANHWRARRAVIVDVEFSEVAVPDRHDGVTNLLDVRAALRRLSEDDQEILRLIGWEQVSLAEAATVLRCGRGAAAVRLYRARQRLAAALEASSDPIPVTSGGGTR